MGARELTPYPYPSSIVQLSLLLFIAVAKRKYSNQYCVATLHCGHLASSASLSIQYLWIILSNLSFHFDYAINHTKTVTKSIWRPAVIYTQRRLIPVAVERRPPRCSQLRKQTWPENYQTVFYQNQNYSPQLAHGDKVQKRPNDDT